MIQLTVVTLISVALASTASVVIAGHTKFSRAISTKADLEELYYRMELLLSEPLLCQQSGLVDTNVSSLMSSPHNAVHLNLQLGESIVAAGLTSPQRLRTVEGLKLKSLASVCPAQREYLATVELSTRQTGQTAGPIAGTRRWNVPVRLDASNRIISCGEAASVCP